LASGYVWTLDGKFYDGDASVLPNGKISVITRSGANFQIEPANLLRAVFPNVSNNSVMPELGEGLAPWSSKDIGAVGTPGSAVVTNGALAVKASGNDIWGRADSFFFVSQPVASPTETDFSVDVQIASLRPAAAGTFPKLGLMIRRSMDPSSQHIFLMVSAGGELSIETRDETDATRLIPSEHISLPLYIRLVKQGMTIHAERSHNHVDWTVLHPSLPCPLGLRDEPLQVGLAFCASTESGAATATVSDLSLDIGLRNAVESGKGKLLTVAETQQLPKGVLLRSGSFLANADVQPGENSAIIIIKRPSFSPVSISAEQLSRINFRSIDSKIAGNMNGSPGLLLANGDFIEGEFGSLSDDSVEISSVLFGNTKRSRDSAAALIIRAPDPVAAGLILHAVDNSVVVGSSLRCDGNGDSVTLFDSTLGTVAISIKELFSLQAPPVACESLLDLLPTVLNASPDHPAVVSAKSDIGNASFMTLGNSTVERGLLMTGLTSVAFPLNGQFKLFVCRVGIPLASKPKSLVHFTLLGDGIELIKIHPVTRGAWPLTLIVPVAGVRTLTLKVSPDSPDDAPATVVWADPMLVK